MIYKRIISIFCALILVFTLTLGRAPPALAVASYTTPDISGLLGLSSPQDSVSSAFMLFHPHYGEDPIYIVASNLRSNSNSGFISNFGQTYIYGYPEGGVQIFPAGQSHGLEVVLGVNSQLRDFISQNKSNYLHLSFKLSSTLNAGNGGTDYNSIGDFRFMTSCELGSYRIEPYMVSTETYNNFNVSVAYFDEVYPPNTFVNSNQLLIRFISQIACYANCRLLLKDFVLEVTSDNNYQQQADAIAGIGSDVSQPDFASTNSKIDSVAGDLSNFESEFEVNSDDVQSALSGASEFFAGDYQQGANLVSDWINQFLNDSPTIKLFLTTCLGLGIALFAIGRGFG